MLVLVLKAKMNGGEKDHYYIPNTGYDWIVGHIKVLRNGDIIRALSPLWPVLLLEERNFISSLFSTIKPSLQRTFAVFHRRVKCA